MYQNVSGATAITRWIQTLPYLVNIYCLFVRLQTVGRVFSWHVYSYEARILQNGVVPVSDTYRIPILRGYSGYRIPEVSELIILI